MKQIRVRPPATRRTPWPAALLACLVLGAGGCASQPVAPAPVHHVTVKHAATALPGPTYAWFAMPQQLDAEQDARVQDPQFRARLQSALDAGMRDKGYRQVDDMAAADFLLAWRAGVRDVEQATVTGGLSEGSATPETAFECRDGYCSQLVIPASDGVLVPTKVRTVDYVQGGLLVEAIEPKTARLLWSAYNHGTVSAGDGSASGLDKIARETLAQLPAAQ